jgi:hypothetical protein
MQLRARLGRICRASQASYYPFSRVTRRSASGIGIRLRSEERREGLRQFRITGKGMDGRKRIYSVMVGFASVRLPLPRSRCLRRWSNRRRPGTRSRRYRSRSGRSFVAQIHQGRFPLEQFGASGPPPGNRGRDGERARDDGQNPNWICVRKSHRLSPGQISKADEPIGAPSR